MSSRIAAHVKVSAAVVVRQPAYLAGLFLFPLLFYSLFGLHYATTSMGANLAMASYAAFSAFGIALMQFGVGMGLERTTHWDSYVRTLPVGPGIRLVPRVLIATLACLAGAGSIAVLAAAVTPVALTPRDWTRFALALLAGAVPFALLGLVIGYFANPRAAVPIANLFYLPLAFLGLSAQPMPMALERVRPYLPTRNWAYLLWDAAQGTAWRLSDWLLLLGWTAAFALLAVVGYRRDEGELFR